MISESASPEARVASKVPDGALGQRMPALDVIRSVAILLVIAHHVSFTFIPSSGDVVARFLRSAGWAGVDIFFALSGFLIAKILLASSGAGDVKRFFVRRFFRIVPLYLIALLVFIVATLLIAGPDALKGIWITVLMLNGWFIPVLGVENVPFTITWSISVEEFAYALLGLSLLASVRTVRAMIFCFIGIAIVARLLIYGAGWFETSSIYYFVPARLDSIGFGALVALGFFPARWSNRAAVLLIVSLIAGLLIVFSGVSRANGFYPLFGYAAFGVVCASLVGAVSQQSWPAPGWLAGSLAWVGKVSYFLYLFHMFAIVLLGKLDGLSPLVNLSFWPALVVVLVGTCAAAWVSWRWFEAPLISLGRKLTP